MNQFQLRGLGELVGADIFCWRVQGGPWARARAKTSELAAFLSRLYGLFSKFTLFGEGGTRWAEGWLEGKEAPGG